MLLIMLQLYRIEMCYINHIINSQISFEDIPII